MTIFFTSDLHLGHVRCATEFRGFDSVADHNWTIISRWNETVSPDDVVFVLGDICMGHMDESLPLISHLSGLKFLVPGNHDRMHPAYRQKSTVDAAVARAEWTLRYEDAGIHELEPYIAPTTTFGSSPIHVSHFPFADDHEEYAGEPRYPEFRPDDDGETVLFHGHIHDLRRGALRQVNVGVDMWDFRPVTFDEAYGAAL